MSRARAGRSRLGCLFTIFLLVAAAYFALGFAEAYWRYYSFRDAMQQQARFAHQTSNEEIIGRLRAKADSLGLPEGAQAVNVRRTREGITIWSEYSETVELPLVRRRLEFTPRAERSF